MASEEIDLKPCPFCRSVQRKELAEHLQLLQVWRNKSPFDSKSWIEYWWVQCLNCGAHGPWIRARWNASKRKMCIAAAEAWNKWERL